MRATRAFRKALQWVNNGTTTNVDWVVGGLESGIDNVPRLAKKAVTATIDGDPHETANKDGIVVDPYHASGSLWTASGQRLTSYHLYPDGQIRFSKSKYGQTSFTLQGGASSADSTLRRESASTQPSGFASGLAWRTNRQGHAEYWSGDAWELGQWSEEHQRWVAYVNGAWCAFE